MICVKIASTGCIRAIGLSLLFFVMQADNGVYADWERFATVSAYGGYSVFLDTDRIQRKKDQVRYWAIYDYETIQRDLATPHLSELAQIEVDCSERHERKHSITFYSGNMRSGEIVLSTHGEPSHWQPILPDSVGEALLRYVCRIR